MRNTGNIELVLLLALLSSVDSPHEQISEVSYLAHTYTCAPSISLPKINSL